MISQRSPLPEALRDLPFAKMTGSGNDFVFFDGREVPVALLTQPETIRAICNRYNGIGADGIVILEPASPSADARILYFNNDGSSADLCGNATLCSTAMAVELGMAQSEGMVLMTGAGQIRSRLVKGQPEIALQPVTEIQSTMPIKRLDGEERIGFTVAGIPHLVILCDDADRIAVASRGPTLRGHPASGPNGANVNWVSSMAGGRWRYRTFERGVEGETLACGTGAVATAVLLAHWGLAALPDVVIRTSSGRDLVVQLDVLPGESHGFQPTLKGEGRVVFRGRIAQL